MIDSVHFQNFKSLADLTLELGRLTVLVGPNGCGKSSVLQGIYYSRVPSLARPEERSRKLDTDSYFLALPSPRRIVSRGDLGAIRIRLRSVLGDELGVTLRVNEPSARESGSIEVDVGPQDPLYCKFPTRNATDASSWDEVSKVLDDPRARQFDPISFLRLDANVMVQTTVPTEEVPTMEPDGSGLASVLAWMKGAAEDDLAQVTANLRAVVPGVKRIQTLRERVTRRHMDKLDIDGQPVWRPVDETQIGDRFAIEFDDGSIVPADLLSEGTVLALGLLTRLRSSPRPRLVLLDDLDRGLHLSAQVKLVEALRTLMELDAELQILCTTHSPYLLDLFKPDEVRVLALDDQRRTHARKLTEHPDFAKWKFGTQTGELWAALGEAWVTGAS